MVCYNTKMTGRNICQVVTTVHGKRTTTITTKATKKKKTNRRNQE